MICDECIKSHANLDSIIYVQLEDDNKNPEIMIVGCEKHLKKFKEKYNIKQWTP